MIVFISDNLEIGYLGAESKFKLDEVFNKKRFTVKDTPLTHRQVNKLGSDKLIKENRKDGVGWRKFSFKELVFITIVSDLRKYGFENKQLKELYEFFYKHKYPSDLAIGCVFGQTEIIITVNNLGEVGVYDPLNYVVFSNNDTHVKINLTEIVNNLISKTGKAPFPVKYSLQNLVLDSPTLTVKEKELINLIRDKNYSAINIKKGNGKVFVIHAEKISKNDAMSPKQLLEILEQRDFQDITLRKRNGKIVHFKVEETIKL